MIARSDTTPRRRVLVVDDSAFMRRLVSELVTATGEFDVVGTARDGDEAIRQVHLLDPDIVTLDIAMPGLDGLDVLGYIMSEAPRPVIMLSADNTVDARTEHAMSRATVRALELGAVGFVRKPSGPISLDVADVADELLSALRAAEVVDMAQVRVLARPVPEQRRATDRAAVACSSQQQALVASSVVVMAASTGGPAALTQVIPRLPAALGAAVLVVQHLPEGFTARLAERLDALSAVRVREARDGEVVRVDTVYLAPGGRHLRIEQAAAGPTVRLDQRAPVWGVRPAADPLFTSAAAVFAERVVSVVLTGMGRDGAEGARCVRAAGGRVLVQDPETAVVAGMPSATVRHAGADAILSLDALPSAIMTALSACRTASDSPAFEAAS
jgi:two-component system, chemotaxis family, protein-glutamate methylesterase/glutaminase